MTKSRVIRGLGLLVSGLLLIIVVFWGIWPGLTGGFFFDDSVNILEQSKIQLTEISSKSLLAAWESGISGPLGRPISMLSFGINYYFFGFSAFSFKLVNLILHVANALLVFCLVKKVLSAIATRQNSHLVPSGALIVAFLWAINPIQLTSVLYVVQRMTGLFSFFVLAGMLFHISARDTEGKPGKSFCLLFLAWLVAFPLALLSKETAVTFVLYVTVYEALIGSLRKGRFDLAAKIYIAGVLLSAGGLLAYLALATNPGLLGGYAERSFTMAERLFTEARVLWVYLRMIFAPVMPLFGLYHDDIVVSTGLFQPDSTGYSLLGLAAMLIAAFWLRSRKPLVSFGILWFLVGHSLESSIFPLELMHEHRNYLPSLGMFFIFGQLWMDRRDFEAPIRLMVTGFLIGFSLYCLLITNMRADMYGDDFRRTQIESSYHPASVRSNYEAGALLVNLYYANRDTMLAEMAERSFAQVSLIDPSYKLNLVGMLQLDCLRDKTSRPEVINQLKSRLQESKWIPYDLVVMHGLAEMSNEKTICLERSQMDALFEAALKNETILPRDRSVVISDYVLYLWIGQKDLGATKRVLMQAIENNPDDVLNRINLLQLERHQGNPSGVKTQLEDLKRRNLGNKELILIEQAEQELKVHSGA